MNILLTMFPYGIVQFRFEKKHSISFEAVVYSLIKEIHYTSITLSINEERNTEKRTNTKKWTTLLS